MGENIKKIRKAKKLSQKEVITAIDMGATQYSPIERGKIDPSDSTMERIAKALGVELAELFSNNDLQEVDSYDKTLMEKLRLIDSLSDEEQKTIFNILDAFIGKKKLKDTLSNVLQDF
ncbi:MAG: helix-turn-helix transcriptional regulator [Microcoleaceae cyanobacterium]